MAEISTAIVDSEELELPNNHPGRGDVSYVRRRKMFFYLARDFRLRGFKSPFIPYTEEETNLWASLCDRLDRLHHVFAADLFLQGKQILGIDRTNIPQLQDLERTLSERQGVSLVPAEGLLHGKIYFACWAKRIMPCTLFMRHHVQPEYTPEPDIVHDVIGHVPGLTDSAYVELIERIGRIAEGADAKALEALVRFYWFSIEFGLVEESGVRKALGAGILSSISEMEFILAGKPRVKPFDLDEVVATPFDPTTLQPVLFVAPSVDYLLDASEVLLRRLRP